MERKFQITFSPLNFFSLSLSPSLLSFTQPMSWLNRSKNGSFTLELDFEPFNASFPRPTLSKYIGDGVEFLNRHLSAKLFHDKESLHPLLKFLRLHSHEGNV